MTHLSQAAAPAAAAPAAAAPAPVDAAGAAEIATLLENVRKDRSKVATVLAGDTLDPKVKELVTSDRFKGACESKFKAHDKDSNNKLTADELIPIVMTLNKAHPEVTVTEAHCADFMGIFDREGKGSLSADDFVEFMTFLYVMTHLSQAAAPAAAAPAAAAPAPVDAAGAAEIATLLENVRKDRSKVATVLAGDTLDPKVKALVTSDRFE